MAYYVKRDLIWQLIYALRSGNVVYMMTHLIGVCKNTVAK